MKRAEALASLSRDHQHGLAVALRLRRASGETAGQAADEFGRFWREEGREHFHIEEDVLLPAVAAQVPPTREAVVRVLTEHVDIRARARDLAGAQAPAVPDLHALGTALHDHIRHEERVLFVLIEAALDDAQLAALARELDASHAAHAPHAPTPAGTPARPAP